MALQDIATTFFPNLALDRFSTSDCIQDGGGALPSLGWHRLGVDCLVFHSLVIPRFFT